LDGEAYQIPHTFKSRHRHSFSANLGKALLPAFLHFLHGSG
jgi:hypothetical protein